MHRIPHRSSLIRNVVLSLAAAAALTGPAMAQTTDAPATLLARKATACAIDLAEELR